MTRIIALISALMMSSCGALAPVAPVYAADKGQFGEVDQETREWVRSLRSPTGTFCCDLADGTPLDDNEWDIGGQGYRVKLHEWSDWIDVPQDAVIPGGNRLKRPVAWVRYENGHPFIVCFLAGGAA